MANVNKVMIIGRVCQPPERYETPSGKLILNTHFVVNRDYKDVDGSKKTETTYLDVVFMGRLAELAAALITKGREVYIDGRLRMQQWTDKQTGKPRHKLDILAEAFQLIGPNGTGEHRSAPTMQQGKLPMSAPAPANNAYSGYANEAASDIDF